MDKNLQEIILALILTTFIGGTFLSWVFHITVNVDEHIRRLFEWLKAEHPVNPSRSDAGQDVRTEAEISNLKLENQELRSRYGRNQSCGEIFRFRSTSHRVDKLEAQQADEYDGGLNSKFAISTRSTNTAVATKRSKRDEQRSTFRETSPD